MSQLNRRLEVLIAELSCIRSQSNEEAYREFQKLLIDEQRRYVTEYCLDSIVSAFLNPIEEHDVFDSYEMVAGFFLNFCKNWPFLVCFELLHEKEHNKRRILIILKSMFALNDEFKHITIAESLSCSDIWIDFLKVFGDKSITVRLLCLENAANLLKTCKTYKIVTSMRKCLQSLILDKEHNIRIRAIEVIDEIANVKIRNICCPKLMKKFASRCDDKNDVVRYHSLWLTSRVYKAMADNTAVAIIFLNHIFKLSSAVLLRYKTAKNDSEQFIIENMFQEIMLDIRKSNAQKKAKNLLKLAMFCTDDALKGMASILLSTKYVRSLMHSLMTLIQSSEGSINTKGLKTRLLKLKKLLCTPSVKEEDAERAIYYLFFEKMKLDSVLHESLRNVCSNIYVNRETIDATIIRLRKQSVERDDESEDSFIETDEDCETLIDNFIVRSGLEMIDAQFMVAVLSEINNIDDKYCIRMASLIVLLSNAFPQLFTVDEVKTAILELDLPLLILLDNDSISSVLRIDEQMKKALREAIEASIPDRSPSPEF